MSELHLAIVECRYPHFVQDELLKDQYIFGLCIKEIQDHLLGLLLRTLLKMFARVPQSRVKDRTEKVTWD